MPALIPREILFGNPEKTAARISPDGRRLAWLAPVEGVLNVWVRTLGQDDARPVTHDTDRGIRIYSWAENNRHLVYAQDKGGDENWRLYSVDLPTGEIRDLTPFENVQARLLAMDMHFPDQLLILLNKDNPRAHDVYSLDLRDGSLVKQVENPGDVVGWVADASLCVRARVASRPDGGGELWVRDTEAAPWRKRIDWSMDDALTSEPVGFSKDGGALYLLDSRDADTARLVEMALSSGERRVLASDPHYDLSDTMIHPDTYRVQAVSVDRARREHILLDDSIRPDFAALAQLDSGDLSIVSRDHADRVWLASFTKDNGPVTYWMYRRDTRRGEFLFANQPQLGQYTLATIEPVEFSSRDGYRLHGYLTCPPGAEKKRLPMVLNVHGGPWSRTTWGYAPEAQWLANRGYACLAVNFRGSVGYGKQLLNAGNKAWGAEMQNDLVDAVQWAVREGIADPRRVAIYGGSYGGYAALVGASFTPDLFACAVDMVGPSDLRTLIRSIPPYWSPMRSLFTRRVGDPETEDEFLKSRSPLFKVNQIRIPVLIAQGANDPRVKQAESEQIVAAMRKKGIDCEYLLFPDEGHGFAKPENRLRFYAAAEQFLAKHLGGRCLE